MAGKKQDGVLAMAEWVDANCLLLEQALGRMGELCDQHEREARASATARHGAADDGAVDLAVAERMRNAAASWRRLRAELAWRHRAMAGRGVTAGHASR